MTEETDTCAPDGEHSSAFFPEIPGAATSGQRTPFRDTPHSFMARGQRAFEHLCDGSGARTARRISEERENEKEGAKVAAPSFSFSRSHHRLPLPHPIVRTSFRRVSPFFCGARSTASSFGAAFFKDDTSACDRCLRGVVTRSIIPPSLLRRPVLRMFRRAQPLKGT